MVTLDRAEVDSILQLTVPETEAARLKEVKEEPLEAEEKPLEVKQEPLEVRSWVSAEEQAKLQRAWEAMQAVTEDDNDDDMDSDLRDQASQMEPQPKKEHKASQTLKYQAKSKHKSKKPGKVSKDNQTEPQDGPF